MTTTQSRPSTDLVRPSIRDRAAHAAVRAPGLLESLGRRLVLTALSANLTLIPSNNITFGGSGANRTTAVKRPVTLLTSTRWSDCKPRRAASSAPRR